MKLDKAIQGFIISSDTELSPRTIKLYKTQLSRLIDYLNNPDVETISEEHLSNFMYYLKYDYQPGRKGIDNLSGASIDKYWIAIRSFFTWAETTLEIQRPDKNMKRPKYDQPEIIPFTKTEIDQILYSCIWTVEAKTDKRKPFRMKRPTADRDRAIILLLLDTGIRLGEMIRLKKENINLENGEVHIKSHTTGIKGKARTVFLGKSSKKAIWFYLSKLEEEVYPDDLLFGINESTAQSIFYRLSERTGLHVHAHRFRHTFAIQYLRNGGDVFTLKRLLGHNSLKMVMYYLQLADSDAQEGHRKASPADRWKL